MLNVICNTYIYINIYVYVHDVGLSDPNKADGPIKPILNVILLLCVNVHHIVITLTICICINYIIMLTLSPSDEESCSR